MHSSVGIPTFQPSSTHLLDDVVQHKEGEDPFAGHDEVVEGRDVAQQLHSSEREGWNHTARSREFEHQPGDGEMWCQSRERGTQDQARKWRTMRNIAVSFGRYRK